MVPESPGPLRVLDDLLRPPFDGDGPEAEAVLDVVPELAPSRGVEQSGYHHLDTLGHVFEVVRLTGLELEAGEIGARVPPERHGALLFAALLHDVAKPITRGEIGGRVLFVAHDTVGAHVAGEVALRLGVPALYADLAFTLTALHLKIGFMESERTDYPPERLVPAAGAFGEELAVLSWADRLAAQGPNLQRKHLDRHRDLCTRFLAASREAGPHSEPDYAGIREDLGPGAPEPEVGLVAARARLYEVRGARPKEALAAAARTVRARS
ncbi:HD domain [Rubrobacter radiotolerans]|uniref:HD domain n=1 Tax=Rubrobacter radiotolerans TaxID=42256 RepID=A0A023X184_RUBRA|nr:HD domain-containing protein [Rubrobacter radiotolerans]AHY45966.1 HD domain [Rubrobacter radiotolerans]MDX5893379.1 HD domain-containing protein [Rubrobacter radiotolerans]SMC03610.1 poly(A) polymerase [Rubrobacter radiotolerans DSM 5868]